MKCFNDVSTTLHPLKRIRSKPIDIQKKKHHNIYQNKEYYKEFILEIENVNFCLIGVFFFEL